MSACRAILPVELPGSILGFEIVKVCQWESCIAKPEDSVRLDYSTLQQLLQIQLEILSVRSGYGMLRVVSISVPEAASDLQPESWNLQRFSRERLLSRVGRR